MGLRIVFMGTPDFAATAFAAVRENTAHEIIAAYARPPAKQGRGMKLVNAPVHQAAQEAGIEVLTPTSLKTPEALNAFAAFNPDLAIVVAYGMILP
jgi:methionyl-tRNA formyltransferase